MTDRYQVQLTRTARRQLSENLPESVATACWEFIKGPLRDNPHRVGKRLQAPQSHLFSARRGTYRVLYSVDDENFVIVVREIAHRRDVYHL